MAILPVLTKASLKISHCSSVISPEELTTLYPKLSVCGTDVLLAGDLHYGGCCLWFDADKMRPSVGWMSLLGLFVVFQSYLSCALMIIALTWLLTIAVSPSR